MEVLCRYVELGFIGSPVRDVTRAIFAMSAFHLSELPGYIDSGH